MSGPIRISGEAFAVERLRENPDLDYGTLRREAEAAGVSIQPIQYGRARKQLGLPPLSTRSEPRLGITTPPPPLPNDRPTAATPVTEDAPSTDDQDDGEGESEPDADPTPTASAAAEAATDIVTPRRRGSPAFDWLVGELRREPGAVFADLKQRGAPLGHSIAPIMYGRAKAVLGLVPVRPRGHGGKRVRRPTGSNEASPAPTPATPRVLKQVESVAADRFAKQLEDVRNLEQLVAVVKQLDSDRRRLRDLLERIVSMIDEALG